MAIDQVHLVGDNEVRECADICKDADANVAVHYHRGSNTYYITEARHGEWHEIPFAEVFKRLCQGVSDRKFVEIVKDVIPR